MIEAISTTRADGYEDQHRLFIVPLKPEMGCEGAEPTAVDEVLYEVVRASIPSEFSFEGVVAEHGKDGLAIIVDGDLAEQYQPGVAIDVELSVVVHAA